MGFTLLEVVIGSSVLVIALFGILAVGYQSYKEAGSGNEFQTGALLANERLGYFRAQANPFVAAGGTYYRPPRVRGEADINMVQARHNLFDQTPVLFAREWLYDFDEGKYGKNLLSGANDTGIEQLNARENRALLANFIPPTPTAFQGVAINAVLPNTDMGAPAPGGPGPGKSGLVAVGGGQFRDFAWCVTPRANSNLVGPNIALAPAVKYVREVWVQTNNPEFNVANAKANFIAPNLPLLPAVYPALGPRSLPPTVPGAGLRNVLPDWTICVTVRVFKRDRKTRNAANTATNVNIIQFDPTATGVGYDPRSPISTTVGYIGLARSLVSN